MTSRVLKYEVSLNGVTELSLPNFADPCLTEMTQLRTGVNLWFEVDSNDGTIARFFQVFGTGEDLPDDSEWQGSVKDGAYIWHVYEIEEPSEPEDDAA